MPTEPWLFDATDVPPQPRERSLSIRPGPERPLSKEERAFNRALARVQTLSRALDEEKTRLDRLLVFHAAEIAPRREQVVTGRTGLVRALAPFLDDRRLTKSQRRTLTTILAEQLDEVLPHVDALDANLQALFERIHEVSYADAVQGEVEDARGQTTQSRKCAARFASTRTRGNGGEHREVGVRGGRWSWWWPPGRDDLLAAGRYGRCRGVPPDQEVGSALSRSRLTSAASAFTFVVATSQTIW